MTETCALIHLFLFAVFGSGVGSQVYLHGRLPTSVWGVLCTCAALYSLAQFLHDVWCVREKGRLNRWRAYVTASDAYIDTLETS